MLTWGLLRVVCLLQALQLYMWGITSSAAADDLPAELLNFLGVTGMRPASKQSVSSKITHRRVANEVEEGYEQSAASLATERSQKRSQKLQRSLKRLEEEDGYERSAASLATEWQ